MTKRFEISETERQKDAFNRGLALHLTKCEIEYIASHGGGYVPAISKGDIEPHEIVEYMQSIGFKYKGTDDDNWANFKGGVSVLLSDGFCYKV